MIAYLDCFAGISGDMCLGALVDLGVPVEWLQSELEKMPLSGFKLRLESVSRSDINARNVFVDPCEAPPLMNSQDIALLIKNSYYSQRVKSQALAVIDCLAAAENRFRMDEKDKDDSHSVEAVVNIVGTVLGLEYLGIETLFASRLPLGMGFTQNQKGMVPLPAPTTLEILKGWPVCGGGGEYETVTTTSAAIVAALSEYSEFIPAFTITGIGYGAGKRHLKNTPDLLRMITGKAEARQGGWIEDDVMIVETCIDDMNPEIFGYVMEKLFEDGALDVVWLPVFMKKNRPGTKIEVLCRATEKEKIVQRILSETTSLGVRFYSARRNILARRIVQIDSPWGAIQAKEVTDAKGGKRLVPEYEVCRRIAKENDLPLRRIYETFYRKIDATKFQI